MSMEEEEGIENILKTAGMIEDNNAMPMLFLKKDYSLLSRLSGRPLSENVHENDAFFEESDLHQHPKNMGFNFFGNMRDHHHDFE